MSLLNLIVIPVVFLFVLGTCVLVQKLVNKVTKKKLETFSILQPGEMPPDEEFTRKEMATALSELKRINKELRAATLKKDFTKLWFYVFPERIRLYVTKRLREAGWLVKLDGTHVVISWPEKVRVLIEAEQEVEEIVSGTVNNQTKTKRN